MTDTAVDQSGARLCAVATNASGTTMSREAVLTVRSATEIPDDGLSIDDVVLRWGISEEVQSRPLFGDSNYLSAGVSDGSALTYESTDRDVRIIHRVLLQSWAGNREDSVFHLLMGTVCQRVQAVSKTRLMITASGFDCP
ncbi:hypothetical protein [Corynebacterium glutamicum]|uniref:hypothetical protein n=1 Tax=Corynebacterium glutamicum TaxID=1718 RepID=UPI00209B24D0|nr:hypothetical protein [Corynebacterium glutamicum]